jgi:pyruvate/2-oxoglutarate dehydrogenase complex dihydrolipoamide acyltransferase (E2) component
MIEELMPMLSETMTEGTVVGWLKEVGDTVAVGDELVEIETDKAVTVYQSDVAGVIAEICAPEGIELPVGTVLARLSPAPV